MVGVVYMPVVCPYIFRISNPGGRSFPLATGRVTEVGAGSGAVIGRSAAGAGVDVGQDQDGASGSVLEK